MFSALIPGLNSVNSPEDELFGQIPAILISLLDLPKQLLSFEAFAGTNNARLFFAHPLAFLLPKRPEFSVPLEWRTLVLCVYVGTVIMIALITRSHFWEEEVGKHGGDTVAPLAGESPEPDAEAKICGLMHLLRNALFNANGGEIVPESYAKHADELQVQEAFCGICFEEKQNQQMYRNQTCSHSFCCDCTNKHIEAKIQHNITTIPCPEIDCKAALDFNACRQIIPRDVLVRWDECLCKSLIPESQKVYCPFRDCSAMLVNDSGEIIKEVECPACQRSICALCRVPWHSDFTCEEFSRLNAEKKGKEDGLVEELAKKKSWRRCSQCKIYLEKTEGCVHITCRCGYEFCYRCGSKWAKSPRGCNHIGFFP